MNLAAELDRPAPPAVRAIARELLDAHGNAIAAILFYGSCRRTGDITGLIDLAVLHDSHRAYHQSRLPAFFNALLPPNVVLHETTFDGQPVRAKIAIYALTQFRRRVRKTARDTTIWARFCQPATLLHVRDATTRQTVETAIAEAINTAASWASRFAQPGCPPWITLFQRTYDAELRPETPGRAAMIYEQNHAWFDAIPLPAPNPKNWPTRVATGKTLNVLRLVKAAFTFKGGADYIAWKLERHTGHRLALTPWQRRHPLLATPSVLVLLRRGRRKARGSACRTPLGSGTPDPPFLG